MNDQRYRQLKDRHPTAAARVLAMRDEEVAGDPRVQVARANLDEATRRHEERNESNRVLRESIERCQAELKEAEGAIAKIDAERPGLAIDVFTGEADESRDQQAQARRQDLERTKALRALALDSL